MIVLWNKLLQFWFRIPQTLRFLMVGGFDTAVAFLSYSCLIYAGIHYFFALIINYFFSVSLSVFNMKFFVYRSNGPFLKEYCKGWFTYLSSLSLNYIFLYVAVDILNIGEIKAQAVYTVIATIYIFFMHKYFTFFNIGNKKNP